MYVVCRYDEIFGWLAAYNLREFESKPGSLPSRKVVRVDRARRRGKERTVSACLAGTIIAGGERRRVERRVEKKKSNFLAPPKEKYGEKERRRGDFLFSPPFFLHFLHADKEMSWRQEEFMHPFFISFLPSREEICFPDLFLDYEEKVHNASSYSSQQGKEEAPFFFLPFLFRSVLHHISLLLLPSSFFLLSGSAQNLVGSKSSSSSLPQSLLLPLP